MITLIAFWTISLTLIFLTRKAFLFSKNKFYVLCKLCVFMFVGGQYYSIFQYGSLIHGETPSSINHFEELTIKALDLPNYEIQWSSLIIMFAYAILCSPKYIKS